MSNHPVGAVGCALLAALFFALAAVAQQRAAASVPEGDSLVRALLSNPRWWAGVLGDIGGYGMQVAALALGAVLLVQPILVSALVFALPLAAKLNGRRITGRTWATALALTAALACFLLVGNPTEGNTNAPLRDWLIPLTILVGLIGTATALGIRAPAPGRRALLLGTASGSLYGLAAALTSYVTGLFEHGIGHVLTSWQTWALVAAGITGVYLQQRAFQAGPLSASLPAVTIAEPLAAAFIGVTVLDERFRTNTFGLVLTGLAVVVMCATTIRLSRTQAAA
ncbi:DMT family transporter [Nocardia iowensis]|uniref:DMT family transporter n=1 Tax=Nocardia iowensis TaxID=204891 RepID=A0ABX8S0R8_NOCIO|nr:DMT family transporter [Nocardia iowensis]QXN95126.1 DMT family transporter [Nocardia iowensis]